MIRRPRCRRPTPDPRPPHPTAGAALALLALCACSGPDPGPPSAPPEASPRPVVRESPPPTPPPLLEDRLRSGEGLDAPLSRLGLEPAERAQAAAVLGQVADPRRLPAGTGVGILRDPEGGLLHLCLRTGPDERVLAERGHEGWSVRRETLPAPVDAALLHARVDSSVYEAVLREGGGPELVALISDVLQWDVDFFADPRRGDELTVLYEMRLPSGPWPGTPGWHGPGHEAGMPRPLRVLAVAYRGERTSVRGFHFEDPAAGAGYFDEEGRSLRKTFLKSPLNYRRISSRFSRRRLNPVTRTWRPHHGVDYAAPAGTPVVSSADGRVVAAGWQGSLGRRVRIRHGSGRFESVYGHLSGLARGIRAGVRVRQNQVIGYVGSTGRATGAHLHYEVHDRGRPVNPMNLVNPPTDPVSPEAREAFAALRDGLLARMGERPEVLRAEARAAGGETDRGLP